MINRFLRRLRVGQRIVWGFLALMILLALTIPLSIANHLFVIGRLQIVTDQEAFADRQLLLASVRIESSRVNLARYLQDYLPSTQVSLNDITEATNHLTKAQELITEPKQQEAVTNALSALGEYQTIVRAVETARKQGESAETTRLVFLAYTNGGNIGQTIEQIVRDSETRVQEANDAFERKASGRLTLLIVGYVVILGLSLVLIIAVARSITQPVAELREGAEALRMGNLNTTIPVAGADELSLLAGAFNQMAAQLSSSYLELEQRVVSRTAELQQRSAYLQAAAEVSSAASSILDTSELIHQVVELIRNRFSLYYVGLFLVDEAREWAVLRAGTGSAGQKMLARKHKIKIGEGMIGWSVANAQARIALLAAEDTMRLATSELPETRSEAALPLRSRGQVMGAFTVQSAQPNAFDQASIAVLQAMADAVAVALENARLFAESETALETARRAYGEMGYQAWMQMAQTGAPRYLCTAQGIYQPQGAREPAVTQASQSGQTVQGHNSTLAIPLKVRDQVLGVVRLRKPDPAAQWTSEEITLLETLTEQLGVAMESARLYQDTQRRAAREQLVGQVTLRIRESLNIETVLKTTASEIRQALDLDTLMIRLTTPETDDAKPAQERT